MAYETNFAARARDTLTPPTEAIPGRGDEMVANRAGGVVFKIDCWQRLSRFLILGADSPTYYASAREMTVDNVGAVLECLRADPLRVVRETVAVSVQGRAPKNDPALYVLALCGSYGARGAPGMDVSGSDLASQLLRSGDTRAAECRRAAFDALPQVARTGTHVMQFCGYLETLRGWGRGPTRAIKAWFAALNDERLALQAVKYRQRKGWTLRDVLRLGHPAPADAEDRNVLIQWIAHRDLSPERIAEHEARVETAASGGGEVGNRRITPRRHAVRSGAEVVADARGRFRLIDGYHMLQEEGARAETDKEEARNEKAKVTAMARSAKEVARIIRSHSVPFECVPSQFLGDRGVWDALLVDMPMTNMLRNLGKMTAVGLLERGSEAAAFVAGRLTDEEALRKARVHPYALLVAMKVYAQGRGVLGDLTWSPVPKVTDALDAGFYRAFGAVRPAGKRFMLGLDVSASMDTAMIASGSRDRRGNPMPGPVSARVASAAMAMVTAATESECHAVGFTAGDTRKGFWMPSDKGSGSRRASWGYRGDYGVTPVDLSARRRLDDVCHAVARLPMGGTDCALPVLYALAQGIMVDVFVTYTDNETHNGDVHATEALRRYRDKTGIAAKMVAVAMTATGYSIADPADAGMMDVVGFDTDAPAVISDFARGRE